MRCVHRSIRRHERGVTLVELMVALLISAILTGIAVQIFSSSLGVQRATEASSRIQQNARFADILLSRDLRQADSFGCADLGNLNSIVATGGGGPDVDFTGDAVTGQEDPGAPSINNSDTIMVRGAGTLNTRITNDPDSGSPMKLSNVTGLRAGDLVMVTNCQGQTGGGATTTEVFQATTVNQNNGDVSHVASGTPGNTSANLVNSYLNGTAMSARQTAFRVATSGDTGRPTLQASVNGRAFEDLISDIHSMQIVYGEDTNADAVANRFVPADEPTLNMGNVVAVRIQLIVMGGLPNVARTGWTSQAEMDGNGNQQVTYDAEFGGATVTLPDGQLGERVTITSALRGRLP